MADTDINTKPASPYDHPRPPLSVVIPTSDERLEKKGEGSSIYPDINNENIEDQDNEERNNKTENDEKDEDENEKKDTEKPLLEEKDSLKIDIPTDNEGGDTPTLPLPDKKKKSLEALDIEDKEETKIPKYLFPLKRIRIAWKNSSNICQFLGRVVCIIFQTVGWLTCAGGIPFLSLVMLIMGSIYVHDCRIQPKIPIYLIVSGVLGTIQHFIKIWTNYVPKDTKGRLKVYRSYCRLFNGLLEIFLLIWFILGCVWVYSAHSEVDFGSPEKDEYCNKNLYYFSFWIFNLSFILLGLLLVLSVCFLACGVVNE